MKKLLLINVIGFVLCCRQQEAPTAFCSLSELAKGGKTIWTETDGSEFISEFPRKMSIQENGAVSMEFGGYVTTFRHGSIHGGVIEPDSHLLVVKLPFGRETNMQLRVERTEECPIERGMSIDEVSCTKLEHPVFVDATYRCTMAKQRHSESRHHR